MREILIYGDIVNEDMSDYWPDTVSPKQIHSSLADAGGEDVLLRFNSVGGSADAGVTICNLLKDYGGDVIGQVDGLAASAATIILMGCKTARMASNSALMIHGASYLTYGQFNAEDFRTYASQLDNYDQRIAATYAKRSGQPADDFLAMMLKDTYMTADEAKELGLVDSITDESDVEVHMRRQVADRMDLDMIPAGVAARLIIDPPKVTRRAAKPLVDRVRDIRDEQQADVPAGPSAAAVAYRNARIRNLSRSC